MAWSLTYMSPIAAGVHTPQNAIIKKNPQYVPQIVESLLYDVVDWIALKHTCMLTGRRDVLEMFRSLPVNTRHVLPLQQNLTERMHKTKRFIYIM
jgi:hypothetical protein